jgi:hypothetical protein
MLIPSLDMGINYVPFDMPAMVHQGERVVTASDNRSFSEGSKEVYIAEVRFPMRDFVIAFKRENDKLDRTG